MLGHGVGSDAAGHRSHIGGDSLIRVVERLDGQGLMGHFQDGAGLVGPGKGGVAGPTLNGEPGGQIPLSRGNDLTVESTGFQYEGAVAIACFPADQGLRTSGADLFIAVEYKHQREMVLTGQWPKGP